MVIQPFNVIRNLKFNRYEAVYASDSSKLSLNDRERFNVFVELDPWDKLIKCGCDCKGFTYGAGKRLCKHISCKGTNPGLLQELQAWGEISEVPKLNEQEE